MNYLLLITVMVVAIDNSYSRCCPCEKKKVENEKEDDNIETLLTNPANNKTSVQEELIKENKEEIFNKAVSLMEEKNEHKPVSKKKCKEIELTFYMLSKTGNLIRTELSAVNCFCNLKCRVSLHKKVKKGKTYVLLACGHMACNECIKFLWFCKQCNGYYCKHINGCNNHTLCEKCNRTYICNNIPDTDHKDKCPSCAK